MDLEGFGFAQEDDQADDQGEMQSVLGFAEMEIREAQKASQGLLAIYDKLFKQPMEEKGILDVDFSHASATGNGRELDLGMRRYAEIGYDANYETIDKAELHQWRSNFTYLNVVGTTMRPNHKEETTNFASCPSNVIDETSGKDHWDVPCDMSHPPSTRDELAIVGTACGRVAAAHTPTLGNALPRVFNGNDNPSSSSSYNVGNSCGEQEDIVEETLMAHGTMEEVLELNITRGDRACAPPSQLLHPFACQCPDPLASQREEVSALLMDALWTDIVTAVTPLVQQVLPQVDFLPEHATEAQCGGTESATNRGGAGYESDGSGW